MLESSGQPLPPGIIFPIFALKSVPPKAEKLAASLIQREAKEGRKTVLDKAGVYQPVGRTASYAEIRIAVCDLLGEDLVLTWPELLESLPYHERDLNFALKKMVRERSLIRKDKNVYPERYRARKSLVRKLPSRPMTRLRIMKLLMNSPTTSLELADHFQVPRKSCQRLLTQLYAEQFVTKRKVKNVIIWSALSC